MINKKISKLLGPAFGIMSFMLAIGILEVPALADDNVQVTTSISTSTSAAATYKDYSININKSVTQNGLKITLENVVATKHRLKAVVKVESNEPFDQNKSNNSIVQLLYGDNNNGGSTSQDYIDDKTMLITIEQDNDEEEFPIKGELRLDVVFPYYKVNLGIDANVNFSESFNYAFEKNLSVKIPEFNYTLNELRSDILGTTLTYSGPYNENDDRSMDSSFILKVGDKIMYKLRSSGSSSDGEETKGTYESKAVIYDMLKDQKDISIIPLECNITWDELKEIHGNYTTLEYTNKETLNNVNYLKSFDFSDGSKGEIYNIERKDNTVKVYCRGNSEKASLLMASSMNMYYQFKEEQINYVIYDSNKYMSFYKDPNDEFGYIAEFNNVDKDKVLELYFDDIIKQIDKYNIGSEIKISK